MPLKRRKRSPPPSVVSLWFCFGLLISSLHPQQVQSFLTISRMSSALGYGFVMDMRGFIPKILTSGIDYETDHQKVTQSGQGITQCYVGVANANGYDRIVFDSPNVCLDIAVMNHLPNEPAVAGLPDAIVTSMVGQQPLILSLKYGATDISQLTVIEAALLPNRYFPAVMTTDSEAGGVYVALHPTHGAFIAPAPPSNSDANNQAEEMRSTWFFLEEMTRPAPIFVEPNAEDIDHSPKIVKYNLLTKNTEWIHTLDTQDGKSLVTGMALSEVRNKLVLVGAATGSGPGIGAGAVSGGDWDGYLTVLDMNDGDLETHGWNLTWNALHSTRIRTQKDMDDVAFNVCIKGDKAFVVGTTQGRFDGDVNGGAFILKFDIDTLQLKWVQQISGKGVAATHCAVRGEDLYVGGTVPPGIELDPRKKDGAPRDTHDVFVTMLNAGSGSMEFLRQIDSHRDDELFGMAINPATSGVIISANARDFSSGENVIFTMDVNPKGNHEWEKLAPGTDPITGKAAPNSDSSGTFTAGNATTTDPPKGDNADDWTIVAAVTIPAVIILVLSFYYFCCLSAAQVPLDYPDIPTHGNAAEDTELQVVTTEGGEERDIV